MKIKLAGLVADSIVDGPGFRFTIFTQGCPHHCEGCHNPQTHDFNGGRYADCDKIIEKIRQNRLTSGVTFSGGEPFCQPEPCAYTAKRLRELGYNLMAFTGFTFEQLLEMSEKDKQVKDFLSCLDIIIDGKFDLSQRSLELRYKGSKNQRTIDVQESLKRGSAVEIEI
ncbi:MAG: anaerobic ribonucleoside-triphosphate reductase activating protein [Bacteroides sp.]|nr:anaerobic ribonucleoside-triphosphate reductase activating protein [Bacteroides sp.]